MKQKVYKFYIYPNHMNKWIELLLGLVILLGAILVAWYSAVWWSPFWNFRHAGWEFLKGGVVWFFIGIGALFILLGISDLKD